MRIKLRLLDWFALFFSIVILVFFSFRVYSRGARADSVHIHGATGEWYYPLNTTETVNVDGPLGITTVQIENGVARVISSPCRDKICITRGALGRGGEWTACLPNGIIVEISAGAKDEIDAVAF